MNLPTWLTRGQKKLIKDARAAGYKIRYSQSDVTIYKGHRYITRGIILWQNGTAVRADTGDLSVCTAIRTQREMREILEI